jgi:hypothetical protein
MQGSNNTAPCETYFVVQVGSRQILFEVHKPVPSPNSFSDQIESNRFGLGKISSVFLTPNRENTRDIDEFGKSANVPALVRRKEICPEFDKVHVWFVSFEGRFILRHVIGGHAKAEPGSGKHTGSVKEKRNLRNAGNAVY